MKCPKCDNEIDNNNNFCEYCGEPIKKSRKMLLKIIYVMFVLSIVGCFVYFSSQMQDEKINIDMYKSLQEQDKKRLDSLRKVLKEEQTCLDSLRKEIEEKKKKEDGLASVLEKNLEVQQDEKAVNTHGKINDHEYVDLGLPSGLKWATCNVGANKPEEYGNYYAWGEIKTKTEYKKDNSVTYGKQMNDIGGEPKYDAARANWGGSWRLPTKEELIELKDKCTWKWTTQNGVKGHKVTGPNGNHIFLPAAGSCYGTSLNDGGVYGFCWSSVPHDDYDYFSYAYGLGFDNGGGDVNYLYRDFGQTVRPVSE